MGYVNANPEVYKLYDSFNPSKEEKHEFNEDLDKFKFYCWIPESMIAVGDTKILFNSLEELDEYWDTPMIEYITQYYKPTSQVGRLCLEYDLE